MSPSLPPNPALSLAERIGIGAYVLAGLLLPVDPRLAALPLAAFVVLCFAAPFLPGFGFFLPIVSRGRSGRPAVTLTFDDGPDPVSTPILLDLLDRYGAPATFFLTGERARQHPDIVREILSRGHAIGNHSFSHDNLIMFKCRARLIREIESAQEVFRTFGIRPLAFRPPVGVTNPRLAKALRQTGLYVVNFSKRAGDLGNRRVRHLSDRILKGLKPDDIIMLHDAKPRDDARYRCWREEMARVFDGIKAMGLEIRPLSELIGCPVMVEVSKAEDSGFEGRDTGRATGRENGPG